VSNQGESSPPNAGCLVEPSDSAIRRSKISASDKKVIDRLLARLRSSLEAGDLSAVKAILEANHGADLLVRIREKKLFLRAPSAQREEVAELLRAAADGLELEVQADFENYLLFALAIDEARRRCLERMHVVLQSMPRCSKADLLEAGKEVFECGVSQLMKDADIYSAGTTVAERERHLHDLNGAANDFAMAVARVVNECSRVALAEEEVRLRRAERRLTARILRQVVTVASEVNSLEWFFDSVTYGEFTVDTVQDGPRPTFRLHFVDARRYLLKTLAIRRSVVLAFLGQRHPRYVREKLKEVESALLQRAVAYYTREVGASGRVHIDLTRAHATTSAMLAEVDAEDDLLVVASRSDPRAVAYYVVAMALRWYSAAADSVHHALQSVNRQLLVIPPIPLAEIASCIGGVEKEVVAEAIKSLTLELPARSHISLADRPFVRDGAGMVRPFLRGGVGSWTCVVREALIQGGAIGKSVGAVWEDFYAKSFDGSDWKVVGRGVKLRSNGRILTDVDLLLLRDDLLLVMQIKALIGLGNTPYDHWRNRQTIQFGCAQARVAAGFFESDPDALVSICGKRSAARIKHVQPVVLTNIDQLDGWRVDDVPVISEVTRKAICRGARVDYHDSQSGDIVHTHHFVKREELTTASILQLLQQSIEMQIAAEGTDTTHSVHDVGGLTLLMPEFEIRPGLNGAPSHEPKPEIWMKPASPA
jgi:hypothetical protein